MKAANLLEEELLESDMKIPIILATNQDGRSFAMSGKVYKADWAEYLLLYAKYDVENTYIHEFLHLFGAQDFYYNDAMSKYAEQYLPQSIMNHHTEYKNPAVDAFTAYLIGWSEELTQEAEKFMEEVNHYSTAELKESEINNRRDGNVTDFEIGGGVYTGELLTGLPHGYGKMIWNFDGVHVEYEGDFKNGYPDGQGTMTYPDGSVEKGIWKEGVLVEPN